MKLTKRTVEALPVPATGSVTTWDVGLPGFGVRVSYSGRAVYVIRYRNQHGRDRLHTFARVADMHPEAARDFARRLFSRIREGGDPAEDKTEARSAPTLEQLRDRMDAEHEAKHVRQQIGISTDERQRERASGVKFITNTHPLLELGWSRRDCEAWLESEFGIKAAKSACYYCPYRSNAGWKAMKEEDPEQFERACQYDEAIREAQGKKVRGAGIVGQLFVWRGYEPLRTARFDKVAGQIDFGFEQECDGMCGH